MRICFATLINHMTDYYILFLFLRQNVTFACTSKMYVSSLSLIHFPRVFIYWVQTLFSDLEKN